MNLPVNPYDGQQYKNLHWSQEEGLWIKNENTTAIINYGDAYNLPGDPQRGDIVTVVATDTAITGEASVNHGVGQTLVRGTDATATGAPGRLNIRPNQALQFVHIGDTEEYKQDYGLVENLLDVVPGGDITSIASSRDGQRIAIGHNEAPYLSVYKWVGHRYTKLGNLPEASAFQHPPTDLALVDDDEQSLYIGFEAGPIHRIAVRTNSNSLSRKISPSDRNEAPEYAVAVSRDEGNRYVADGQAGGSIYISDKVANASLAHPYAYSGSLDVIHALKFRPGLPEGSHFLVVGHNGSPAITFLKWSDGDTSAVQQDSRTFRNLTASIKSMAWSPDGSILAVVMDGTVKTYAFDADGECREVAEGRISIEPGFTPKTVAFSSTGVLAVSFDQGDGGSNGKVDFYNFGGETYPTAKLPSPQLSGIAGDIADALWTGGGAYFLVGADAFHVYLAEDIKKGVWQVVHMDGAKPTSNDFKIVT